MKTEMSISPPLPSLTAVPLTWFEMTRQALVLVHETAGLKVLKHPKAKMVSHGKSWAGFMVFPFITGFSV